MSWAEFSIRSYGYNRVKIEELRMFRTLGFTTLLAPNADPKKLPKSPENYMPLPGDEITNGITDQTKKRFAEEYKKYLLKKGGRA